MMNSNEFFVLIFFVEGGGLIFFFFFWRMDSETVSDFSDGSSRPSVLTLSSTWLMAAIRVLTTAGVSCFLSLSSKSARLKHDLKGRPLFCALKRHFI